MSVDVEKTEIKKERSAIRRKEANIPGRDEDMSLLLERESLEKREGVEKV